MISDSLSTGEVRSVFVQTSSDGGLSAEQIADFVDVQVQLVEVHPTHERLEVSVVNLNENR